MILKSILKKSGVIIKEQEGDMVRHRQSTKQDLSNPSTLFANFLFQLYIKITMIKSFSTFIEYEEYFSINSNNMTSLIFVEY